MINYGEGDFSYTYHFLTVCAVNAQTSVNSNIFIPALSIY